MALGPALHCITGGSNVRGGPCLNESMTRLALYFTDSVSSSLRSPRQASSHLAGGGLHCFSATTATLRPRFHRSFDSDKPNLWKTFDTSNPRCVTDCASHTRSMEAAAGVSSLADGPEMPFASSPQDDDIMVPLDPLLLEQSGLSETRHNERRPSVQSIASNSSNNSQSDKDVDQNAAPSYPVHKRLIGAVEVPMVVMNLDRAEMAFGNISTFKNVCCLPPLPPRYIP